MWLWVMSHVREVVGWNPSAKTGWTFFTLVCCKNGIVCLKRPKINKKEAGVGTFYKKAPIV